VTRANGEVHVEKLVGRAVLDKAGQRIGRIAEIVVHKEGDEFVVTHYIVGPIAWMHRFAVSALDWRIRGLGVVYRVEWNQMDLSDPDHPRTACTREELTRETLPRRKRGLTRRPARRLA
jgi:sporulation protein YlmC with PRC-barrel domain